MTTKTKRKVRLFRYEVTEVDWPKGEAPLTVGAVIIDKWNSDRCWEVHNFSKKDHYVGSWSAKLLGELTEEEYAQHEAQKAARAEGRMVPMPDLLREHLNMTNHQARWADDVGGSGGWVCGACHPVGGAVDVTDQGAEARKGGGL